MTERERSILLRSFDAPLSESDAAALKQILAGSEGARFEYERVQHLRAATREVLQLDGQEAVTPFFAERLTRRLTRPASPREDFSDALMWLFQRVAIAALLITFGLVTYNLISPLPLPQSQNPIETAFSIPPSSPDLAYDLDLP
ncbi:MAG TPA: hypothetical protein VFG50_16720 [Rhodothermales bacterium]|nr:hypothetical protein [Rhodothermales bacterium]